MNDLSDILERVADRAEPDTMASPSSVRSRGSQRTRRALAGGAVLVAAAVAVAGASTLLPDRRTSPPAGGERNTLEGWHLTDSAEVPGPGSVSIGDDGFVWVSSVEDRPGTPPGDLTWYDPVGLAEQHHIDGMGGWLPLFTEGNILWQAGAEKTDTVWVGGNTEMQTFRPSTDRHSTQTGIVSANGSVYVTNNEPGTLSRLDRETGKVLFERPIAEPGTVGPLATDGRYLYVGSGRNVLVLDGNGNPVDRVTLDGGVSLLVRAGNSLIVATQADHLAVLDISTPGDIRVTQEGQIYPTIDTPLMDLEVAGGYLWAVAITTEQLVQLDPQTLEVRGTTRITQDMRDLYPSDLAAGDGSLFVRTVDGLLRFTPE